MQNMEEGGFVKRIRDVRAEGKIRLQTRLEAEIPAPPGMSIDDVRAAAPTVVSVLERLVIAAVQDSVNDDEFSVPLARETTTWIQLESGKSRLQETWVPTTKGLGTDSQWWSAICAWADAQHPTRSSLAHERYDELADVCYEHVCRMWNEAHPEFPAELNGNQGTLEIDLRNAE